MLSLATHASGSMTELVLFKNKQATKRKHATKNSLNRLMDIRCLNKAHFILITEGSNSQFELKDGCYKIVFRYLKNIIMTSISSYLKANVPNFFPQELLVILFCSYLNMFLIVRICFIFKHFVSHVLTEEISQPTKNFLKKLGLVAVVLDPLICQKKPTPK